MSSADDGQTSNTYNVVAFKIVLCNWHHLKGETESQPQFAKWKLINGKQDSVYTRAWVF